jgi:hypothetical protein
MTAPLPPTTLASATDGPNPMDAILPGLGQQLSTASPTIAAIYLGYLILRMLLPPCSSCSPPAAQHPPSGSPSSRPTSAPPSPHATDTARTKATATDRHPGEEPREWTRR